MFKNELILGSFLAKLFPLLVGLYFLFFYKNKFVLLNLLLLTLLVTFTIIISAERTATALHFISIFLLIFFLNIQTKYKLFIFLSLFVTTALFVISNPHVKHRVINEALLNSDNAKYVFSKVHHAHYLTAINIFLEKPILGSGVKTFRHICDYEKYKVDRFKNPFNFWHLSCSTHPHNLYIQLLSETGIIGFIFIISFLTYIIFNLFKNLPTNLNERYYVQSIFICLLVNFFPFSPSGNFFNNYVSMIYILPISFMLLKSKINK
tara:strand:- start:160 stop:951 length:792 start_codon:yes stop_codon:yes gene_type:complete